jgi:hypothetical protein
VVDLSEELHGFSCTWWQYANVYPANGCLSCKPWGEQNCSRDRCYTR